MINIKNIILKKLKEKREIKVADIVKATGFSRAYVNRFFKELREEGKIVLLGRANKARYILAREKSIRQAKEKILEFHTVLKNKNVSEEEVLNKIKKDTGIFFHLPQNVIEILDYAFTEILNNAIEHSRSKTIRIDMKRDQEIIRFDVIDEGIGIFNHIMKKKKLRNELEAIQDLIKGKQTTAPESHSGEGLFFTSKVGDRLAIKGSAKKLVFDKIIDDIFISDIKNIKGTKVNFVINIKSKRGLVEVFRQYSQDLFEFNRTKVVVKLYRGDDNFMSRSQAKRILSGLEKFKIIVLDFDKIDVIGQSFADEIFRIWQDRHPHIRIQWINGQDNVNFMIKRAINARAGIKKI